ncbi:Putative uncharacterized protein [Moritella viscosa]|uniref:hypothetical protein n=1 Tax=Moritella viscosa TaxID=80854 RepID=UPI00091A07B7|nr:hypothetical protein [Moritella viscosa]SGZ10058.1 Putative uncharacterized protein [Moritella viscosa]
MELITSSILGGIIYDIVKEGIAITKDSLGEQLKKWAAESIAPNLAEALLDIEVTSMMSEKAIELELEKNKTIVALLAQIKTSSQGAVHQEHTGSGHNLNHTGSGHIVMGDYNEKK